MANNVSLNVMSSDDKGDGNSSTTTLNFDSLSELARLLQMAGIKTDVIGSNDATEVNPTSDIPHIDYTDDYDDFYGDNNRDSEDESPENVAVVDGSVDLDIADDGSISMTDENADYDYRLNPTSKKGFVYNVDPYSYEGDAELDTRDVPARSGDNPLRKVRTFESYLQIVEDSKIREKPKKVKKGVPLAKNHKLAKEVEPAKKAKIAKPRKES